MTNPLVQVRNLRVEYLSAEGAVRAVDDVSFEIQPGEVFGLAGESGSGKSTAAHALLRTLGPPGVISGGEVNFAGKDVLSMTEAELRRFRWTEASMVFQSAMNSLNPVLTVGQQIRDTIQAHQSANPPELDRRAGELMELVGMDPTHLGSYPHQLSGGMRQRVVIAIALCLRPRLLIMDEPTTALDVVVQKEILQKIAELKRELDFSILFITHDLSLMFEFSTTLAILYAGRIVEIGPAADLLKAAKHPYTQGLMRSFPSVTGPRQQLEGIGGNPPNLRDLPSGCRFHPRCSQAFDACPTRIPELLPVAPNHRAACHLLNS